MEAFSNGFMATLGVGFGIITICTAAAVVDLITAGLVEGALRRRATSLTLSQSTATRTN
jgi:hypothetical protein